MSRSLSCSAALCVFGDGSNTLNLENTTSHTWALNAGSSGGATDEYVSSIAASAPNLRLEVDDIVQVNFV